MERRLNPQQKKQYSLEKDCRNCYGENDKSSRTAIRARKRWVNRSYRRTVQQQLQGAEEQMQDQVQNVQRKTWTKIADRPLGEMMLQDQDANIKAQLWQLYQNNPQLKLEFIQFLEKQHLKAAHFQVLLRRGLDCMWDRNLKAFKFNAQEIVLLELFLLDAVTQQVG